MMQVNDAGEPQVRLTCLHLTQGQRWLLLEPPDLLLQPPEMGKTSLARLSAGAFSQLAGPPWRQRSWTQFSWERIPIRSALFTISRGSRWYFVVGALLLLLSQWKPKVFSTKSQINMLGRSRCQRWRMRVGWKQLSNQRGSLSELPQLLPLISSPKHTCGVSPTHPNKGTNDFNYGLIAEAGVN